MRKTVESARTLPTVVAAQCARIFRLGPVDSRLRYHIFGIALGHRNRQLPQNHRPRNLSVAKTNYLHFDTDHKVSWRGFCCRLLAASMAGRGPFASSAWCSRLDCCAPTARRLSHVAAAALAASWAA